MLYGHVGPSSKSGASSFGALAHGPMATRPARTILSALITGLNLTREGEGINPSQAVSGVLTNLDQISLSVGPRRQVYDLVPTNSRKLAQMMVPMLSGAACRVVSNGTYVEPHHPTGSILLQSLRKALAVSHAYISGNRGSHIPGRAVALLKAQNAASQARVHSLPSAPGTLAPQPALNMPCCNHLAGLCANLHERTICSVRTLPTVIMRSAAP
jgi:hypothetical protein